MKKIMIIAGASLVVVVGIALVLVFVVFKNPSDKVEKPKEELSFQFDELYTNIPLGDDSGSYKILKLQMIIKYTDPDFEPLLINKQDEIIDYLNGYFRDMTVKAVNRKNGKERAKVEIYEYLIELFETDSDNFTKVLLTQFIIQ